MPHNNTSPPGAQLLRIPRGEALCCVHKWIKNPSHSAFDILHLRRCFITLLLLTQNCRNEKARHNSWQQDQSHVCRAASQAAKRTSSSAAVGASAASRDSTHRALPLRCRACAGLLATLVDARRGVPCANADVDAAPCWLLHRGRMRRAAACVTNSPAHNTVSIAGRVGRLPVRAYAPPVHVTGKASRLRQSASPP